MGDNEKLYEKKYRINRPDHASLMEMLNLLCVIEDLLAMGEDYFSTLRKLNELFTIPATIEEIAGYYEFQDEEDFIIAHTVPDYHQFGGLADDEILWLIKKIIDNPEDEYRVVFFCSVVDYNTSGKPGRCNEMIFYENIREPSVVLEKLRLPD